jgi:hypothetical protein
LLLSLNPNPPPQAAHCYRMLMKLSEAHCALLRLSTSR